MPVNQPPISEDVVQASWQYEITGLANELELILQRNRASRGPAFPPNPELGAEHYLTDGTTGWYKYDTGAGWVLIGG